MTTPMTVSKPETVEVTQALEPCPFCGVPEPGLMTPLAGDGWWVRCYGCGSQSDEYERDDQAIAAWNLRHRLNATPSRQDGAAEPWPGCYADLQERRVTTLAKLGLMLSIMAGGDAPEVVGFDAADLHGEVLMALAIEDAEDTDVALEVARDHPEGDMLVAAPGRQDGLREALRITTDGLYQVIALDHHNMGPESAATKVARAHILSAEEKLAALSDTPPPDNEEMEAVKKILADGLNNAAASAPGWRIKILSEAMHKALSAFNNGGK